MMTIPSVTSLEMSASPGFLLQKNCDHCPAVLSTSSKSSSPSWLQFNHIPMTKQYHDTETMCLCSRSLGCTRGSAMWQSFAAHWQICEGGMNYLWQALALFAGFINSSGGCISKVPTNTVEKHVLWHLSTHLIGNLGLQDCRMHLRSQVSSIIHRKCKNYRRRSSSPSEIAKHRITGTH